MGKTVAFPFLFCKQFKINKMEHFVFLVFIADIPDMYKKLEIRNGNELWGDGEYICESFYVQKIVLTSTEKLKNL